MPEAVLKTEVAVIGGGLVGMALALKLAQHQIHCVLLEATEFSADDAEQFDDRTLVINPASKLFWQELGLWSDIESHTTTIDKVHVSNQGRFGVVQFDKDELEVTELGHVIVAKRLAQIVRHAVLENQKTQYLQPAKLNSFEQQDDCIRMSATHRQDSRTITAQLMVAADGVQSSIRSQLNLETVVKSYHRQALICNITTDQKHQNRAFERLTREGPMALLPFKNRFGFVWSMAESRASELLDADDDIFLKTAQQAFGYRAGIFQKLGRRSTYPLFQIQVPQQHAHRVVLMGNAAHSVSPVSAQGLNLAVRGVSRLCKLLAAHKKQGNDLGAVAVLQAYQDCSQDDQNRTMNYTDDLMTWFKIDEPLVNALRSLGLVTINANLPLKKMLFHTAGGLR